MLEIAGLLDDTIAKAAELSRPIARSLRKSLSFDPSNVVDMGVEDAEGTHYTPYRRLGDGSYAPHAPAYWMEQTPGVMPDGDFGQRRIFDESEQARYLRRDGYREVDGFYRQAGVMKAVLDVEIDELVKGLGVPKRPKPPLQHHEKVALVKQHLQKRRSKEKMDKEKTLDAKIKQAVDATLADHFETHQIKTKVHATMQKRLGAMGPEQRSKLHQTASGMGRPATPDETAWSGMAPKTKAKPQQKPTPAPGF